MEPSNISSGSAAKKGGGYIPEIDLMRAFAMFLVVAVHFSVPSFQPALAKMGNVVESIIHLGWMGVPVFLFISGYSLGNGKIGMSVNIKNFYINRILRIYPLYIICAIMLLFTHKLSGEQFISILLMQTQTIPKLSAFAILWTIQLEFFCYLLFPILVKNLQDNIYAIYIFLFFFLVRIFLYFLPLEIVFNLSYSSLFGGATLFAAGILATRVSPPKSKRFSLFLLILGVTLTILLMSLFYNFAGDHGFELNNQKFLSSLITLPEIVSLFVMLIIVGLRGLKLKFKNLPSRFLTHTGRISYSGYVFHMFILDFFIRVVDLNSLSKAGLVSSYISVFICYFALLLIFSHISYKAIELPFLNSRKQYAN
jgi:peptidoglycan/LPS O-acetylase OafA/YrhL